MHWSDADTRYASMRAAACMPSDGIRDGEQPLSNCHCLAVLARQSVGDGVEGGADEGRVRRPAVRAREDALVLCHAQLRKARVS